MLAFLRVGEREGEGAGQGGRSAVLLWVGWQERRNEDDLKDAENNTSNKLVVTAQSGRECLA